MDERHHEREMRMTASITASGFAFQASELLVVPHKYNPVVRFHDRFLIWCEQQPAVLLAYREHSNLMPCI